MTINDHINAGSRHGFTMCEALKRDRGEVFALAFISGVVSSCAVWNTHERGSQSTFDLLSGLIDDALEPKVALACLEAELRAIIRKNVEGA